MNPKLFLTLFFGWFKSQPAHLALYMAPLVEPTFIIYPSFSKLFRSYLRVLAGIFKNLLCQILPNVARYLVFCYLLKAIGSYCKSYVRIPLYDAFGKPVLIRGRKVPLIGSEMEGLEGAAMHILHAA